MITPNHRKQRANNSREHILDTYVDLLIRSGERAATLDAVATAAKVSKGGLLYHFSSKKALLEALAERTLTLAEEDFAAMEQAPEGASAYYINSSTPDNTPFDRALIALSRLAQNNNKLAQQTMSRVQEGWHALVLAELGDEQVGQGVQHDESWVMSRLPAPYCFWVTACTTTRRSEATPPARRGQPPSLQTVRHWNAPCRFSRRQLIKTTKATRYSS